jgi:AcrR family transcriptional regulator
MSDVARLAGVERHTLYRYFPQLRDLFLACSGRFGEEHPPPDVAPWLEIDDPASRLRRGLGDLYSFYEQVEDMYVCVLRDAEYDPLTQEISRLRQGDRMVGMRDALLAVIPSTAAARATLQLALDFRAWRQLARDGGLSPREAADAMTRSILAQ